ncbi:radical SAM protein [Gordonibacter sp. An230]|uniref:TIGR03936 family radical SAM-associated protein n=1 Tax=Gordonibacter sp. An230 TaxID=1965592 RepID=UPI000B3870CD|nr:TIGR03936 family radical SAM-associated protein [Gordonibacter sp. An230]OUO90855.1 radical SAM protein [Gordonibacter sp. An230]
MPDPSLFRLRATFCKQGRLALLSHLEVARALERAVRRAGLPFAVSRGFSPHMKISFGSALPVGVGGTGELFDLQMTRYVPPETVLEALQKASVPDLMVKSCAYIEPHAPAASAAYPLSTYRALLSRAVRALSVPETVTVVRKRKEKELSVAEFLVGEPELSGAVLTFSLESKPTGSLRPDVLLRACLDEADDLPLLLFVENASPSSVEGDAPTAPLRALSVTRISQASRAE